MQLFQGERWKDQREGGRAAEGDGPQQQVWRGEGEGSTLERTCFKLSSSVLDVLALQISLSLRRTFALGRGRGNQLCLSFWLEATSKQESFPSL